MFRILTLIYISNPEGKLSIHPGSRRFFWITNVQKSTIIQTVLEYDV